MSAIQEIYVKRKGFFVPSGKKVNASELFNEHEAIIPIKEASILVNGAILEFEEMVHKLEDGRERFAGFKIVLQNSEKPFGVLIENKEIR